MQKIGRFERDGRQFYGSIEGQEVSELAGGLFDNPGKLSPSGKLHAIDSLKLLAPVAPPKILAVGLNYRSHLGTRPAPTNPEIFYKPITALQHPDEPIVIPPDAQDV